MGYNEDRAYWEQWFPADFITESFPGQFRNWFYAILAMSTMMEGRPPFKVLLGHAQVFDQNGDTMGKAKGNSIEFNGAADSGYELFTDRDPKLTPEAQAKRDLPAGFVSASEGEVVFEGKPKQVVKGRYRPIGADVIRWLYCRQNPAANINFGPGPADEVRAKFHLKLWNSYAFFCNYAGLEDGFDPHAPPVPVAQRRDLDRWILSDLQLLIQKAREALDGYNVQAFCLAAEAFVDDKLSNWYIRRSRRVFQKNGRDAEKLAAFQTLHTALVALTRLVAPVLPFLAETMHQQLVVKGTGSGPASVHLCDYPVADLSLVDEQLSRDMDALLRLVTIGSAARNEKKIKVRQPLAELKVQPADDPDRPDADRRAVERFGDLLRDELNVKRVTLHDPKAGPLLTRQVKPNMKALGPRFGARLKDVLAAIAAAPLEELAVKAQFEEPFTVGDFTLEPGDFSVKEQAPEGWSGWADRGTQVVLDVRITPELAREGMARDVIRRVQDRRREAGLEMEDRIVLYLATPSEILRAAIDAHRDYIAGETLTTAWASTPPARGHSIQVTIEGHQLTIALGKMTGA
jgi:isoleucyl-tRNA synthetase